MTLLHLGYRSGWRITYLNTALAYPAGPGLQTRDLLDPSAQKFLAKRQVQVGQSHVFDQRLPRISSSFPTILLQRPT